MQSLAFYNSVKQKFLNIGENITEAEPVCYNENNIEYMNNLINLINETVAITVKTNGNKRNNENCSNIRSYDENIKQKREKTELNNTSSLRMYSIFNSKATLAEPEDLPRCIIAGH